MKRTTKSRTRLTLAFTILIVATLGVTSCDGEADHYFAIFGPPPGPDCAAYCVASGTVASNGDFEVKRGDKVRFINFTKSTVTISLEYTYLSGTGSSDTFALGEGKSKKKKIKNDIPNGTIVEITYKIGGSSAHGGPQMIVEP